MHSKNHFHQQQQGAALLVALIILVLVSLMGISALRSSIFSGKIATSVQADAMTFEAAETALGVTFRELGDMSEEQLSAVLDGNTVEYCIKHDNTAASGSCGNSGDFMDQRGLLRAQSTSYAGTPSLVEGGQISYWGGMPFLSVAYNFETLAESEMPTLSLENFHLQETRKRGLLPASDIRQE